MKFIPLGIDCTVAAILSSIGVRTVSYPFDWNVTYQGVATFFENNFTTFLPKEDECTGIHPFQWSGTCFMHHSFPEHIEKYKRRIRRMLDDISTAEEAGEEIIFMRKSHAVHHHNETENLADEVDDLNKLFEILKKNYPSLRFKIVLFLTCSRCYKNKDQILSTTAEHSNIEFVHFDTENPSCSYNNMINDYVATLQTSQPPLAAANDFIPA